MFLFSNGNIFISFFLFFFEQTTRNISTTIKKFKKIFILLTSDHLCWNVSCGWIYLFLFSSSRFFFFIFYFLFWLNKIDPLNRCSTNSLALGANDAWKSERRVEKKMVSIEQWTKPTSGQRTRCSPLARLAQTDSAPASIAALQPQLQVTASTEREGWMQPTNFISYPPPHFLILSYIR